MNNIDELYCRKLGKSPQNDNYDFMRPLMAVYH